MKPLVFISLLLIVTGLDSCGLGGSGFGRATGAAYEVIVVMSKDAWESNAGAAVREELTAPVPYLLNAESSMSYQHALPDQLSGFLRFIRNILVVTIDKRMYTKVSLLREDNKWATGQLILYLNAPDAQSVETYLSENQRVLVNYFNKEEMKRTADFLRENYSPTVLEKVRDRFGISIYAPFDIKSFNETNENVLWFTNNAKIGQMHLLVYTFPYVDTNTFTLDYLVAKRDSIAKLVVPGAHPGSYMTTEKRVVDYFATTLNGKYCGVLRGLWRMEGDMMGGPFVSFARVDEPNRRVIVTEGFVYEPNKDKRNYIRRIEAALYTTRFADELN